LELEHLLLEGQVIFRPAPLLLDLVVKVVVRLAEEPPEELIPGPVAETGVSAHIAPAVLALVAQAVIPVPVETDITDQQLRRALAAAAAAVIGAMGVAGSAFLDKAPTVLLELVLVGSSEAVEALAELELATLQSVEPTAGAALTLATAA
jgi:hypothetical protein